MDQNNGMGFMGYQVNSIVFQLNPSYSGYDEELGIEPDLSFEIVRNKNVGVVVIQCNVFQEEDSPFYIEVEIEGGFDIQGMAEEAIDHELRHHAVAILYPYLRAVVANITASAGVDTVHLPVVDVSGMTKDIGVRTIEE